MKPLHELVKEDWAALYLLGRISRKLGTKKGQTITQRIDEMIDVIQSCYSVKEQPLEMVEALNKLNRSI
jgi:hypothetical protein